LFVIADGLIVGSGNDKPTPDIVLDVLGHPPTHQADSFMFPSLGDGQRQLNYGKVYSGHYAIHGKSIPYIVVVKVGTPKETSKPGNRGKRDTQLLLMKYLNHVHFDADMSPLELEITRQMKHILNLDPKWFEFVLWVDADTEVYPDAMNRLIACMSRDAQVRGSDHP
jgi:chitin synthase